MQIGEKIREVILEPVEEPGGPRREPDQAPVREREEPAEPVEPRRGGEEHAPAERGTLAGCEAARRERVWR